ncbi:MAG: molybdopterin-dependent oxidoreductase, partial [Chloroflexi bacterium]|nr:molybdopterin-dependent oxidoreductase [Chloroflexota bacterium]
MSEKIQGLGHSRKRVEDARFIRGKGNYIDDIKIDGMIYLDIVRSPYAHAKIKSINDEKALATPGVLAVITGKTLEEYNVHNMPTLMNDTQMVLPLDTVKYQYQEVAGVLATSRYAAADGVAAVEVDYDPLPVIMDPIKALEKDSPKVRDDKDDNHIWHWEWGDKEKTQKVFDEADVTVEQDIYIPRIHVSSIETCGCIAKWDAVEGQLT